jgi:hypothetical protein
MIEFLQGVIGELEREETAAASAAEKPAKRAPRRVGATRGMKPATPPSMKKTPRRRRKAKA